MVVGGGVFTPGCRRLRTSHCESGCQRSLCSANMWRTARLMSYRERGRDFNRRAAFYVDKLIKGAKPADLPVQQPTRFFLTINRKTTRALGLTIRLDCLCAPASYRIASTPAWPGPLLLGRPKRF